MNPRMLLLNTGLALPSIGITVSRASSQQTYTSVSRALRAGYRHIDLTRNGAMLSAVGAAVRASGVPRHELFITMKVCANAALSETIKSGYTRSVKNLDLGPPDLLLLSHSEGEAAEAIWPLLERLYWNGEVKSIGIRNFYGKELERLLGIAKLVPAVSQVAVSPLCSHRSVRRLCHWQGIVIETNGLFAHPGLRNHSVVTEIATSLGKSAAQILMRWGLQSGMGVLAKSPTSELAEGSLNAFSFELSAGQMKRLDQLDEGYADHRMSDAGLAHYSQRVQPLMPGKIPWSFVECARPR